MVDGNLLVENLIEYSKEYLHLSEYDTDYLRIRLYKFFSLDLANAKKYSGRGKLLSKDKIVSELKGYIGEVFDLSDGADGFLSSIFGRLIPLPSQIDRNFKSLREHMGSHAAFDYFYSIADHGNFVIPEKYSPLPVLTSKKTDIIVSSEPRDGKDYLSIDQKLLENFRAITFESEDGNYKFGFLKYTDCDRQAELRPVLDKPFVLNKDTIEGALSFAEYLPQLCVLSSVCGKNGDNIALSDRFYLIEGDLPLFEAEDLSVLSSASFPDADISIVDYPVSTVRFLTFNRNTVTELTAEIIAKWNVFVDEENDIHGNAKIDANRAFFSVKILNDGRYMVHISLTKKDDFDLYSEKRGVEELFSSRYYPLTLAGRFVIDKKAKEIVDKAVKFIQKKSSDKNGCEPLNELLVKIESENLFVSNSQKALSLVLEKLYGYAENFLFSQSAFTNEERWLITFKKFLATIGIK